MEYLEKLVMTHINRNIPVTLDQIQFAFRRNRSVDDAISLALYTALGHLVKKNTCIRMLFIRYSSAFNKTVPSSLPPKSSNLGLSSSTSERPETTITGD